MTQYRKIPVVIDAFQYGKEPRDKAMKPVRPEWFEEKVKTGDIVVADTHCFIKTLEGQMTGEAGDYIIQGVKGEIYPCKPDIFEMTYERVL